LSDPNSTPRFTDYPLRESILKDIEAAGFQTPMPIQAGCIGPALEGKDVIGLAQTGTGKTAAFALPMIQNLCQKPEMAGLILAPTRELANQIVTMFNQLGRSSGVRVMLMVGGMPYRDDERALQSWPNILVATPGRLIDHLDSGTVSLNEIEVLVVDEADRMHDMGFIPQIRRILAALPAKRQTMMFTATMPPDVERIALQQMRDPVRVLIGRRSAPAEGATQHLYRVDEEDKPGLLLQLLRQSEGRVLIFLRTKRGVDRLGRVVSRYFRSVTRLHSDRIQADRDEAMAGFRNGKYRILIATDIAARGLDIADIEHVINFDFPLSAEDYVHRIGRTARVAAAGLATSFVTRADTRYVRQVEQLVGSRLELQSTDGDSHRPSARPVREEGGSSRRPRRRRGRRSKSSTAGTPASG